MKKETLTGILLDEDTTLTLDELSHSCQVKTSWIIELVDEGILEPAGKDNAHWCFSTPSIQRVQITNRLQCDLGVNIAGAALILDMLDEIDELRSRLQSLE